MIRCEVHGLSFIAAVSRAIERAILAGERWDRREVVAIRTEWRADQEPRARFWIDRATAGDRDDGAVVPFDEAEALAPGMVCSACCDAWLRSIGVDLAYTEAEQRFLRLAALLAELLRPRLQPAFEAFSRAFLRRDRPTGHGCQTWRGCPFAAYTEAGAVRVELEVRDHGDHLVAKVTCLPPGAIVPDPLAIALTPALELADPSAAIAWIDAVAQAVYAIAARG